MPARSLRLAPLLLAPLVLGACASDLPEAGLIISHRVLAIRTAVTTPLTPDPELDGDRPKAQALPFETVEITPFIVNPEGEVDPDSLDVIWLACQLTPGQGLFSCLSSSFPTTLADIPECEIPSFSDLSGEELPEPISPCLIAREGTPEYVVPLSANVFVGGAVELTMIAGVPGGTSTDTCASEILGGAFDLPDDCLFAVQRLSLGPIEQLVLLAAEFGVEIPGVELPEPDEVPEPDRNPRISEIRFGIVNTDGEQVGDAFVIQSGDLVSAPIGATVQVEVDSPEDDLQVFQIPVNNGESFEDRDEAYQGDWYRTWGTLLSGSSDDPMSYNQWQLEPGEQDVQPGEDGELVVGDRVRMFYTVRDGRQGVNWFWFELELGEPLPTP
jgi:hypothetical protein